MHDINSGDGEVLPPEPPDEDGGGQSIYLQNNLLAVFEDSYTDRPDLLIAEIEKHDPGFVRRMNAASEAGAAELREARFAFGKHQAYTALALSVLGAAAILVALVVAVVKSAGFLTIISLGLVYAITQGGSGGFSRLIDACADMVRRVKGDEPNDRPPPAAKS